MYWPEEDSVSVIKQENVVLLPVLVLKCGEECSVKIWGTIYVVKCLQIGENAFNCVEDSLLNALVLVLILSAVHV